MNNVKEKAIMFGKAQCSAWVASAVDFGITLILTSIVDVWFHTFGMKKKYVALRYTFVWVGSIVLNTAGTWQLTELSGANYMISKTIVAAFVAVFWNYHLQRTFVFRANRNNQQA